MSDKPVSVGDLVAVVHECCQQIGLLGRIRQVTKIQVSPTRCPYCGDYDAGVHVLSATSNNGVPIHWVKRIPPPDELGIVDEHEELTA